MIKAAKDSALVPKDQQAAMNSYGNKDTSVEVHEIPAVQILNGRGEYSMSMGVLPPRWRPIVKHLPWYSKGSKDVKSLAGIAIMAVAKRLATPTDRVDLLSKLQNGRDNDGNLMGREELTAEALTLLIAGSDTTSKSVYLLLLLDLALKSSVYLARRAPFSTTSPETVMPKTSCTKNWTKFSVRKISSSQLNSK